MRRNEKKKLKRKLNSYKQKAERYEEMVKYLTAREELRLLTLSVSIYPLHYDYVEEYYGTKNIMNKTNK